MMISEKTVWNDVWPVVENLIQSTLAEDSAAIARLVVPGEQAAELLDLFGFAVFDLLLKTVLGRGNLGVTRAIETENGRYVHIEFAWPEPGVEEGSYTAADVVTVTLTEWDGAWRVVSVNPASVDLPITGPRARSVLATTQALNENDKVPGEPWILPIALFGGALQLTLRDDAMADEVEALLLPAMQERNYGVLSIMWARRLWRDFRETAVSSLDKPAGWAAAVEFIMNEQNNRSQTQAAVGKLYKVNLSTLAPRLKQIKKVLKIKGQDERYSDLQPPQIVLNNDAAAA